MARTKKTPAPAPAIVSHLPRPPVGARPAKFTAATVTLATRPGTPTITADVWTSPDGWIVVQRGADWRPEHPAAEARYVVSVIVRGIAWTITMDTQGLSRRPHTATTIRALGKAIAGRVAADPTYVRALEDAPTDHNGVPQGYAVDRLQRQISDLLYPPSR
jgi:hypothetical protein